jgi:hypothetical protein
MRTSHLAFPDDTRALPGPGLLGPTGVGIGAGSMPRPGAAAIETRLVELSLARVRGHEAYDEKRR